MENLYIAELQYDIESRVEYQRYADFLRLGGIYVWERNRRFEKNGDTEKKQDGPLASLHFTVRVNAGMEDGEASFNPNHHKNALDVLKETWEKELAGTEYSDAFKLLRDVYVDCGLFQAGVTLQVFRMADELVEQAGICFENARGYLEQEMEKDDAMKDNRHVRYAYIYCGQRANMAREWCRKRPVFDVENLAEQCLDLLEDCPDFSNAWALQGLIYQYTEARVAQSVHAYESALRAVGTYPFASSIYYWEGKRCEDNIKGKMLSKKAYFRAYDLDKKYRIIYKKAMVYEKEKNLEKAMEYYKECLERIRKKGSYLDPLEQEYFFKVSVKMGYFYLNEFNRLRECTNILEQALTFREQISQGQKERNVYTAYYFNLYGEKDAGRYILLALRRMRVRQIYGYLYCAYEKLGAGEEKKAAEYRKLYQGCKE